MPAPAQPAPLEIQTILSLTGSAAFVGHDEAQALAVIEKSTNDKGGIGGRPIHFVIHDDGTNPVTAVELANQIMAQHPPIILGSTFVATCGAIAPLMQTSGPVEYCFSPGLNPPPRSFAFAGTASLKIDDQAILRYMHRLGYTRLAIISSTDATGEANDKNTDELLPTPEFRNLQIVAREHFGLTDIDVSAQVAHIKNAQPQAVVAYVSGPAFGTLLRGLKNAGVDLPVVTSGANANAEQLAQYVSFLPSNLILPAFPYSLPPAVLAKTSMKKPIDEFVAAFKSMGYTPSPAASPYVWDTASIVISAFRKLGPNATAQQIHDYILGLKNYIGINGTYDFTTGDQHGLTADSVVFVRFDPQKKDFIPISGLGGAPL